MSRPHTAQQAFTQQADLQMLNIDDLAERHGFTMGGQGRRGSISSCLKRRASFVGDAERRSSISLGRRSSVTKERRGSILGRGSSVAKERRGSLLPLCPEEISDLESAFNCHKARYDLDGDGTMDMEELINIFQSCKLFNEHFRPEKIRDYFRTWSDGCNHHMGLSEPMVGDAGIGFAEFRRVLNWAADMNRIDFDRCCAKVVTLSRRLTNRDTSVQCKLEVIFDCLCKKDPEHMNAFEFGRLCKMLNLPMCMGDIFSFFCELPHGGLQGPGVDFAGFMDLLLGVGDFLGVGEEIYSTVAKAIDVLDTDEETINRVRFRMRQSASIVGGGDWRRFFTGSDNDGSGRITFEEFVQLCRERLHLMDKESHLRLLFERIDQDGSDELTVDELIQFVAAADKLPHD